MYKRGVNTPVIKPTTLVGYSPGTLHSTVVRPHPKVWSVPGNVQSSLRWELGHDERKSYTGMLVIIRLRKWVSLVS